MSEPKLNVLMVVGSPRKQSATGAVLTELGNAMSLAGCAVDLLDLSREPLPPYNPDTSYSDPDFTSFKERMLRADVIVLGSPDYHGSVSSTLKNFLDHFWQEFTGKLVGHVVASHEKGLTVIDQLRTMARQCYAWAMPYAVSLQDKVDVVNGVVASDTLKQRLEMFARDLRVYGTVIARQRRADLAGVEPGFLARHRS